MSNRLKLSFIVRIFFAFRLLHAVACYKYQNGKTKVICYQIYALLKQNTTFDG